jgi:hypothetical protein
MNLLEKMNAEEFKKLLEYKEKYPTLGENLIEALTDKIVVIHLTIAEYISLCDALGIYCAPALNQVFQAFKSKP